MTMTSLLLLVACSSPSKPASVPAPPAPLVKPADPTPVPPPAAPLVGVYLDDLDRSVDPCTDFFEYANGGWRKANPIPPSMTRWSLLRGLAGLPAPKLRDILEPIAAKRDWKAGSVEQQIGDFYGSCMDAPAADAADAKPIEPWLAEIAAIKDRAGLRTMIAKLATIGLGVPFYLYADNDLHTPTDVVANLGAAGLGLPDRDYYVKPEKRFVDARAKYQEHIVKMFELAGKQPIAKAAAKTVFTLETKLAKAHLDNVALREPKNTDHKMTVAELQKLSPSFDWTAYLEATNVPRLRSMSSSRSSSRSSSASSRRRRSPTGGRTWRGI